MKLRLTTDDHRPGPNDREPCPSESCDRWHIAHGIKHRCGKDKPARQRVEGVTLRRAA